MTEEDEIDDDDKIIKLYTVDMLDVIEISKIFVNKYNPFYIASTLRQKNIIEHASYARGFDKWLEDYYRKTSGIRGGCAYCN